MTVEPTSDIIHFFFADKLAQQTSRGRVERDLLDCATNLRQEILILQKIGCDCASRSIQ
jgi:hypothetical protein